MAGSSVAGDEDPEEQAGGYHLVVNLLKYYIFFASSSPFLSPILVFFFPFAFFIFFSSFLSFLTFFRFLFPFHLFSSYYISSFFTSREGEEGTLYTHPCKPCSRIKGKKGCGVPTVQKIFFLLIQMFLASISISLERYTTFGIMIDLWPVARIKGLNTGLESQQIF